MTYNPWRDLADRYPGVHVELHPIAPAHAFWSSRERVIVIDSALSRAERRAALAHEIAHMDTGDVVTGPCWFAARQETAADKLAARRLVSLDDLCRVVRCCPDPREAAAELDVPLHVLRLRGANLHPAERGAVESVLSRREAVA